MKEEGYYSILMNELVKLEDEYCISNYQPLPPSNDLRLGYEKIIFLFIILIIGFILSSIVVMLEKMKSSKKIITDEEKRCKKIEEIKAVLGKSLEGLLDEEKKQSLTELLEELA